jgi:formate dehydrogenase (coenzyme F420) beta subunit
MPHNAEMKLIDKDPLRTIAQLMTSILKLDDVSAVLAPMQLPMEKQIMPMLVTDPERLERVDPLAPAFPLSTAKVVSRLTRKTLGGKIVALLRPCEIRAFIELEKLNQGDNRELVMVAVDCLGAYPNKDYYRVVGDDLRATSLQFYENAMAGETGEIDLAPACKVCTQPFGEGADIQIGLLGRQTGDPLIVTAATDAGIGLLSQLDLETAEVGQARQEATEALMVQRQAARDKMMAETTEATSSLEKLTTYLAHCTNCYNCRVACPVCYCKECVFVTDAFNHDPVQYLQWAQRKGEVKMPTDTVFYHITRLAHMSTACVGCGQCSNACPNDIPVAELFMTISQRTQKAFDYQAGRSLDEKPPLSVFKEDEFEEVVGITATI